MVLCGRGGICDNWLEILIVVCVMFVLIVRVRLMKVFFLLVKMCIFFRLGRLVSVCFCGLMILDFIFNGEVDC